MGNLKLLNLKFEKRNTYLNTYSNTYSKKAN